MKPNYEKHYEALKQILNAQRDQTIRDLQTLLTFATVSGSNDPEEQRLFRDELARGFTFLNGLARRMGFAWRNYDSRLCVIELTGGPEVVGIPLHIDVVPAGEGWNYPAFGGVIEDGVLYGRGTQDDKGPIIQMLYAAYALKQLGVPLRRTVRLIVASQEETGKWDDVYDYLKQEPAPDFSIVSDSDFPIVNGEKGLVDVDFEFDWDGAGERAGALRFESLSSGERSNVVPSRAEIRWSAPQAQAAEVAERIKRSLEAFLAEHGDAKAFPLRVDKARENSRSEIVLTFLGKGAHGSAPQEGHNAAVDALDFLTVAPETPRALADVTRFLAEACRDDYGSGLNLAGEHDFIGKTTVNLGVLRVAATHALATVNVRPTYGSTSGGVLDTARSTLEAWASGRAIRVSAALGNRPHEPLFVDPKDHPELIGALQEAFTRATGAEATLASMGGSTFAKAFPNAVSFGPVYLAEEKKLAHQADECVSLDGLMRNVEIYALALLLLAAELDG